MITSVSNGRLSRSSDLGFALLREHRHRAAYTPPADRVLNLSADIALGVNQQLFCGEQHRTDLTDPGT